ncbi:uncharacterized histidine-rich protein DDB_G0274557 [Hylaeus anthracinus]|uniref:uncharacterized histidine-rich protein DDB_G0274557 n=1 Tax=Hylaeus anthracinus TaxID=313031 RepID=UPI0023B96BAA|nr:uncharacterized histidine-rich protein DDB_G0274557 [Hylaeus anthracinus]
MKGKFLYAIALLVFLLLLHQPVTSSKVIIHVPYRVKNVKHTHIIYKILPQYEHEHEKEEFEEEDKYEIYLHLRIYVPDIVNHHVHTKTIYIRLQKPKKKPKTHHKEHHHENWSSWSYGHHHDYNDEHDHEDHEDLSDREPLEMEEPRDHPKQHVHPDDSYFPQSYVDDNNLEVNPRGRDHNQYAVHENVKDIPPNSESLLYNYEEGYRKGLETESGHIRTGQTSKFHTDQHEEQNDDEAEGSKEDFTGKTHSGRYLVDDVEYENTRDKRQGRRRLRRMKKV